MQNQTNTQLVDLRTHFQLRAVPFTRELPIEQRWRHPVASGLSGQAAMDAKSSATDRPFHSLLRCTPQSTPRCTESGSATIPGPNLRGDSVFRSMCLYEIHGTKRRDAHGTHLGVPFPVPV